MKLSKCELKRGEQANHIANIRWHRIGRVNSVRLDTTMSKTIDEPSLRSQAVSKSAQSCTAPIGRQRSLRDDRIEVREFAATSAGLRVTLDIYPKGNRSLSICGPIFRSRKPRIRHRAQHRPGTLT